MRRSVPVVVLIVAVLSLFLYFRGNTQRFDFEPISEPIVNPLMGWAPWATIETSNQPHTLVYAGLTWREYEPREGEYAFEAFEQKQQLARWRHEGKRVVFRFVADNPGHEAHLDIPDWLFEKINGSGNFYDNEYGMGFSPDYSNRVLIEAHRKAILALGERYGGDGFFAFIELGSLGHWGEWHTHPDIGSLPSEEIRSLYIEPYVEAFPDRHLLTRRPYAIARAFEPGLYNDMTGEPVATNIWLDWIAHGAASSSPEAEGLAAMRDAWQRAPIGGEQAFALTNEQIYGADLEQTLGLLRRSHTTFIGPGSPYEVEYGEPLQAGIDRVLATIGYRIYVARVTLPRRVHFGKDLTLRCTFANNGIAPIYYNWPTYLYVFSESGDLVSRHQAPLELPRIQPGKFLETTFKLPVKDLRNGAYSIGIGIVDPLTDQPAVQFANQNPRQDLIQYLGSFEIKRPGRP